MSGTRPTPAEQHLGDRLAALVDGELSHDVRERVLSHLASCTKCKTEADSQRRLKSVFSQAAPPPPSEGLLARLQGLPGGPGGDGRDEERPFGGGGFGNGVFGVDERRMSFGGPFGYEPAGAHSGPLPETARRRGFRIHDVGRSDAERSGGRGWRFAFVAASAVSLAAIALGGAMPLGSTPETNARGEGSGSVTPMRTTGPAGVTPENSRRQGGGSGLLALSGSGSRSASALAPAAASTSALASAAASTSATAPPSVLLGARPSPGQGHSMTHPMTHPFSAPAPALSAVSPLPLIRPSGSAPSFINASTHGPAMALSPPPTQSAVPAKSGLPVSR
ncbi:anti-sigma factor [Streptomyces sp. H27-C3]|uniref:anti-sigma factor family protein n=1 Tax=Streptomyces sp. H27-C3 TaxID=3046305 RepID=UPI0024B8B5AE|nr:anti-sigma factor [Streptomyces sp. H27-C3]MDJ0465425.1 anti-sigma factor [Streptomyces sp. H27-C3]